MQEDNNDQPLRLPFPSLCCCGPAGEDETLGAGGSRVPFPMCGV